MKKVFIAVSIMVSAMSHLTLAQLPFTNDFEAGSGGSIFSNAAYSTWTGSANVSAMISNVNYSSALATAYIATPIEGAHSSVLSFSEGTLTNTVSGTGNPLVVLDVMIQPSFTQELTADSALSNSQFGIAFTTNGNLALYHGGYVDADPDNSQVTDYKTWTVFSNGSRIASGKWVRVTATINYDAAQNASVGFGYVMLKVAVDGVEQTDASGNSIADLVATNGGAWFVVAKWTGGATFNNMVLNGSGMLDDLVINTAEVPAFVTTNTHIPYGWLTAKGVVTNGASSSEMNAAEDLDSDVDGMLNWQEYLADTDPLNYADKLTIVSQVISNGLSLRWLSGSAAVPYSRLESRTNLTSGIWMDESFSVASYGTGTNGVNLAKPTGVQKFYRVNIVK